MGRSTERETLHQHLVASLHTTADQRQVDSSRASRETHHLSVQIPGAILPAVDKRLQVRLESIHVRAHRHHPVGVKRLLHIFLFQTRLTHVGKTKINRFSFHS